MCAIRGQLAGVGLFLAPCRSWELSSGCGAWQQVLYMLSISLALTADFKERKKLSFPLPALGKRNYSFYN